MWALVALKADRITTTSPFPPRIPARFSPCSLPSTGPQDLKPWAGPPPCRPAPSTMYVFRPFCDVRQPRVVLAALGRCFPVFWESCLVFLRMFCPGRCPWLQKSEKHPGTISAMENFDGSGAYTAEDSGGKALHDFRRFGVQWNGYRA
jgi:hypothetical protein